MNAKKTPNIQLRLLGENARSERLETDKRLIACEKAAAGPVGMTLVLTTEKSNDNLALIGQLLPDGTREVFAHLDEDAGPVAVVVESEHWSEPLSELLAALRDRANRRVIVHLAESRVGDPVDQRMVALGYRRLTPGESLYVFDIETYKETPDWLSPRNWANPELWDKFRW